MNTSFKLGRQGEARAAAFLKQKKYRILEKNYRHRKAEVDLIALKDNLLIAVEIKTRSTGFFGAPETFLKRQQQQRIVEAIDFYVKENQLGVEVRFDIVSLIKVGNGFEIKHLKNAFYHF
jgi:putative endonuclease